MIPPSIGMKKGVRRNGTEGMCIMLTRHDNEIIICCVEMACGSGTSVEAGLCILCIMLTSTRGIFNDVRERFIQRDLLEQLLPITIH